MVTMTTTTTPISSLAILLILFVTTTTTNTVNAFLITSLPSQKARMTTSLAATSTKATATTTANKITSPYTPEQLQTALDSLWRSSKQPDYDARHIYGYKDANHEMSMLQIITATRILDYQGKQSPESLQQLEQDAVTFAKEHGPILDLASVVSSQYPSMALAAEFKRASPSKGRMADADLSCGDQTAQYARAGANVISVLTEPTWFQGSLEDLRQARERTAKSAASASSRPAILRKEFVVNEYMIAEAAANGADTVLLIVAVLPQHLLTTLIDYSRSLGMEPLVEVHAMEELEVALESDAKVIGVNNRNLHTFQMDLNTTNVMAQQLSKAGKTYAHNAEAADNIILCSLSGMSTADDVDRYRQIGVGMCLIGESLMRSPDPQLAIRSLCLNPTEYEKSKSSTATASASYTRGTQIVKVCGITSGSDATVACQAGANWIGCIFVPKSKRCVTKEQAKDIVSAVRTFGERTEAVTATDISTSNSNNPVAHFQQTALTLERKSKRPLVVGVFQNQDSAFIKEMVKECGLDLVQLHGKEGMQACAETGAPTIRVVDMEIGGDDAAEKSNFVESLLSEATTDPVALLLDTSIKGAGAGGGTGQTFDWNLAEQVQNAGIPVLIAGGLQPENVGDCISQVRPWGVDVSSGVEEKPGTKDVQKVKAFCQTARSTALESAKGF